MKRSGRLFFFIILNILISACTTLAVLLLWDQLRGPLPAGVLSSLVDGWREPDLAAPLQPTGSAGTPAAPAMACIPYQALEGDTIAGLAELYQISADRLRSENGFTPDQELKTGDLLCIPVNPQGEVVIDSVVGAGDLETEHISLENQGQAQLPLSGWRIEDGRGNVFIFPQSSQYILYPSGGVNIYTRSGVNNVMELYWGMSQPVWSSGLTVTLRDAQGNVQATYQIP